MEYTEGLRSRRPKGWPNKSSKILTTRALPSQKPQSQKEFWYYKSTCNFLIQCHNWKSAVYLQISEEYIMTCIPRAPSCFSLMAIASFFFSFRVERRTSSTWEEFHKARYIIGKLNKKSSSIALGNAHHTFSTGREMLTTATQIQFQVCRKCTSLLSWPHSDAQWLVKKKSYHSPLIQRDA